LCMSLRRGIKSRYIEVTRTSFYSLIAIAQYVVVDANSIVIGFD
jgi:hypothetical protein